MHRRRAGDCDGAGEDMTTRELIRSKRSELMALAEKYGVSNIRLFGSALRGDDGPGSDIDLLVDMEEGRDLFDLGGFQYYASELLGRRVDVLTDGGIHHLIKDRIIGEARPL